MPRVDQLTYSIGLTMSRLTGSRSMDFRTYTPDPVTMATLRALRLDLPLLIMGYPEVGRSNTRRRLLKSKAHLEHENLTVPTTLAMPHPELYMKNPHRDQKRRMSWVISTSTERPSKQRVPIPTWPTFNNTMVATKTCLTHPADGVPCLSFNVPLT